ncbi:glycoside hydrolase family 65 protein [Geoalkalibacter halelectricus]|uniref:glycoside hydrolase family 65 protein n=1 Tax=Geoalkalibacter halelectricus TaxID=2847045 RepID=UPI003D1E3AB6
MIRHETLNPPLHIYPVNEWKIIETAFYPRFLAQTETLFAIGNGYLGMRGNYEEGRPCFQNGTFINGFHETWPIVYGEKAYGFARTGQTMLNVTDAKTIRLYVDDEPFFLPTASLQLYERVLDMQTGTLDFEVLWETPSGKQVLIESRRLVSLEQRHVAAISYQVTVLNGDVPLVISSELQEAPPNQAGEEDPRQARGFARQVLLPAHHQSRDQRIILGHRTAASGMTLACGVDHRILTDNKYKMESACDGRQGHLSLSVQAQAGRPVQLFKFITYHSSRGGASPEELCARAERTLDRVTAAGFDHLLRQQRAFLDQFWHRADVEIEGDAEQLRRPPGEMQQALRWNLFQILQASARAEGTGIPAKGLTGQTYEGHYFWDTEIYLLPFITYTEPRIARNLLRFRHSMLDRARERAREVNQRGALFPWRTINGEEASAYYAAGTAQYHINADIIYALRKYVEVTDDKALLYNEGAEMLVETARLWLDLGFFSERKGGKFCIHGVTGPDEYTTVVNNNSFTNLMARENLWFAAATVAAMQKEHPEHYATLVHKTALEEGEVGDWQRAADAMYIPYDEELGIHPQDDEFLDKEVWDIKNTPRDKFPLLLYHHPLVIYRHQVIKQADVVLAMFLLGDEFSRDQKKRNFDYYDPLTTGDSSLSACIQAIIAAEIGNLEEAVRYARYAVLMDLADVGGNVRDGCHIASMGGTWMVAVYGFAGMRDYGGRLSFDPRLPKMLCRLRFCLIFQGQDLEVEVTHERTRYRLREGQGLILSHQGERVELKPGETIEMPLGDGAQEKRKKKTKE